MTVERHAVSFPRLVFARVVQFIGPLSFERAQGKPGADCARSTVCKKVASTHTALTGTAETSRLSPRNGLTAYTCSPRGAAFLAPVASGRTSTNVAPGSRRQDHTTSPYAAFLRPAPDLIPFGNQAATPEIAASIASRTRRIRDDRASSLSGRETGRVLARIYCFCKVEIFRYNEFVKSE
jgi:hypothetical protein